jgi:hypothetical protein
VIQHALSLAGAPSVAKTFRCPPPSPLCWAALLDTRQFLFGLVRWGERLGPPRGFPCEYRDYPGNQHQTGHDASLDGLAASHDARHVLGIDQPGWEYSCSDRQQ